MRRRFVGPRSWVCGSSLLALMFAPALLQGDTIVTQVTCASGNQSGIVASSACSQSAAGNLVQESLATSITQPGSASDYFTFQLSDIGMARAQLFAPDATASSSASVDISLTTAGASRAGYIEVIPYLNGDAIYSVSNLSFSIGTLTGSCATRLSTCSVSSMGVNYPSFPRMYAFTLGDTFSLDVNYSSMLDALYEDYQADTDLNFDLQFRFLEADGVTPVALSPEPSTWTLAGVGLLGALLVVRRKRLYTNR